MTIFEIPEDRLSELDDAVLRELVARLCEAERERSGGHRAEVRWGGAQTAADGGMDVMVEALSDFEPNTVLSRRVVGLQVKKSDLSASRIEAEMRPEGILRESIEDIARQAGAYLIVSAGVSCSKKMLDSRRRAMRQALGDLADGSALHTDFIDRHALARWVVAHPSVSLWLRERLALPTLRAWVGYSRWSSTPEGVDDTLICEQGLQFRLPGSEAFEVVPEALEAIRNLVRTGTKAIRIAGLSGIGKTRLVQALFEQTGFGEPLPRSWAVYADVGHDPDPSPLTVLEILLGSHTPAVLIVDNCAQETHRVLAEKLAKSASKVALITIEYDVRGDRFEETDVVRIEAVGEEIVEALVRRRYPGRSSEDARRLAALALGNARLALALAAAAPDTGSLSSFDSDALFQRLFWQRSKPDQQFEQSAEALSLVYSFDVEGVETPNELGFLSELTGVLPLMLHRHATALVERGLAQVRGRWRAVLPHALANRLASRAIRALPWRDLATAFGHPGVLRLRRSFARRLAYLHDVREAREIVLHWIQPGGPIDPQRGLPAYEIDLLERVCHLVPVEALDHVRQLSARAIRDRDLPFHIDKFTRLLRRLAHSPDHFGNAVLALMDLAVGSEQRVAECVGRAIEGLFGRHLSGTLARTEQRIELARCALLAQDPKVARLGLTMLSAALETSTWSPPIVSCDARPDAYGWTPRGSEVVGWFRDWVALGEQVALGANRSIGASVRETLAAALASLWRSVPPLRGDIEMTAMRLNQQQPWIEGWNAFRRMRGLEMRRAEDQERLDLERFSKLIDALKPLDLVDRARAVLRSEGYFSEEPEDCSDRGHAVAMSQHSSRLRAIGEELAAHPDAVEALGCELFESRHNNPVELGRGLGAATTDPMGNWRMLRDLYLSAPERSRKSTILSGFLVAIDERFPDLSDAIRCECLATTALRQTYADFAPVGQVSETELDRMIEAASDPEVWARQFGGLVWYASFGLSHAQIVRLLLAMRVGRGGQEAVIDALAMLGHGSEQAARDWPPDLRDVGIGAVRSVLMREGERLDDNLDYRAAEVVQACLLPGDEAGARPLVDALVAYAGRRYGLLYGVDRTVKAVAQRSPMVLLDRALASADSELRLGFDASLDESLLSEVEPQALVDWSRKGSSERWSAVAKAIQPFVPSDELQEGVKAPRLSAQAHLLLATAPDPEAVVAALAAHVAPMRWSGSLAASMEQRLSALEQLRLHPSERVRNAFGSRAAELRQAIARQRDRERTEHRDRDVSFE